MKNQIIRNLDPEQVSFRAFEEDGKRYLIGYASVFSQRSKPIFENNKFFREVINPNAFDEILTNEKLDVILTFNHDRGRVMARTVSGTLKLSTDEKGLLFRAEMPNVSYANDVYELVLRGDLFENSFAFNVRKSDESWEKDENGDNIRTINKIARLHDVSVVTSGAYANTDVIARFDENTPDEEEVIPEQVEEKAEVVDNTNEIEKLNLYIKTLKLK